MLKILGLLISVVLISSNSFSQTVRDYYEQAVDAFNKSDFDQAISLYRDILKSNPDFAPAYVGIGLSLKSKGSDLEEVLYYYKKAVKVDPKNVQAYVQLGRLYYSMSRYVSAETAFLQALKLEPSALDVKMSLGWLYLMGQGKPATAIKYFKDVVAKDPQPNAYFGLGMAYFANNNRVEAMEIITVLKSKGHNDLALQLEKAVRENQRIVADRPAPTKDPGVFVSGEEPAAEAVESSVDENSPIEPTGIKVKLRGKLSSLTK